MAQQSGNDSRKFEVVIALLAVIAMIFLLALAALFSI